MFDSILAAAQVSWLQPSLSWPLIGSGRPAIQLQTCQPAFLFALLHTDSFLWPLGLHAMFLGMNVWHELGHKLHIPDCFCISIIFQLSEEANSKMTCTIWSTSSLGKDAEGVCPGLSPVCCSTVDHEAWGRARCRYISTASACNLLAPAGTEDKRMALSLQIKFLLSFPDPRIGMSGPEATHRPPSEAKVWL